MKKIEFFKVEGNNINRVRKHCPKCGPGVFLADHNDRYSCGKCGYTEFKGGAQRQSAPPRVEEKPVEQPEKTEEQQPVEPKEETPVPEPESPPAPEPEQEPAPESPAEEPSKEESAEPPEEKPAEDKPKEEKKEDKE